MLYHHSREPRKRFQSTRPIRGATTATMTRYPTFFNFNPRAPYGARLLESSSFLPLYLLFQSTRPIRGATPLYLYIAFPTAISIHAPHTGRDGDNLAPLTCFTYFNPRAPYGARRISLARKLVRVNFNPRAPYGARLWLLRRVSRLFDISIHAPHTGRDITPSPPYCIEDISIHAPHTGRDVISRLLTISPNLFQSTRPIRGATLPDLEPLPAERISIHAPHTGRDYVTDKLAPRMVISIHAPHTGRDLTTWKPPDCFTYFNPRAPYGARRHAIFAATRTRRFQSTRPIRGATLLLSLG